jgi:hypothetical protein
MLSKSWSIPAAKNNSESYWEGLGDEPRLIAQSACPILEPDIEFLDLASNAVKEGKLQAILKVGSVLWTQLTLDHRWDSSGCLRRASRYESAQTLSKLRGVGYREGDVGRQDPNSDQGLYRRPRPGFQPWVSS